MKEEVMPLGIWWDMLAGVVMGVLLSGAILTLGLIRTFRRKRGVANRRKPKSNLLTPLEQKQERTERQAVRNAGLLLIALGALLAVVLALAYATSPGAEHPLDWTSQQLDKLFGN
jgi:hypothetical protein